MPPGVGRSHGDHAEFRTDRPEERPGRRGPAAVVTDLQEVRPEIAALSEQDRIERRLQIPRQEDAMSAKGDAQDERVVVSCRSGALDTAPRIEHLDAGPAQDDARPPAREDDGPALFL